MTRRTTQGNSPMKSPEWKTYRTRFLVKAKQLSSALSFIDHLGRQHCGRKGDYLVESCEGVLSIAPRHIFEDVYVPMSSDLRPSDSPANEIVMRDQDHVLNSPVEAVHVEKIRAVKFRVRPNNSRHADSDVVSSRPRRKSPQPVRQTPSRMGLM